MTDALHSATLDLLAREASREVARSALRAARTMAERVAAAQPLGQAPDWAAFWVLCGAGRSRLVEDAALQALIELDAATAAAVLAGRPLMRETMTERLRGDHALVATMLVHMGLPEAWAQAADPAARSMSAGHLAWGTLVDAVCDALERRGVAA